MASQAAAQQLPMRSETFTAEVGGRSADFLLTAYTDRLMVVVTQTGTLGTMLHAERASVMGGACTYSVETLLGPREQPLAELCARQLAEQLAAAGCDRPLLLCLALERQALTRQAVQQVISLVLEHPIWQAPAR